MVPAERSYEGLMHAGAGTGLFLVQLSVIIPGLMPGLLLAAAIGLVVVLPALLLGLVVAVLGLPPYGIWRLVRRRRQRALDLRRYARAPRRLA